LKFLRSHHRGQGGRHPGERAIRGGCAFLCGSGRLFFGFDPFPEPFDGVWAPGIGVAKDVRVPAQHFFSDGLDHVTEGERPLLLCHARMEYDLKQKVAQLIT
jgi:hypothetical protein